MNNKIAIMAVLGAGSAFSANAQELSVSATVAYESQYIFRGAHLGDATLMPSVDLSIGGFYAGMWAATPLDPDFDIEVDFYAGYAFDVSDTLSLDFGGTYYTYPDQAGDVFDNEVAENTFEIFGGINFSVPLSPAVYVFYDFDLEALTVEGSVGHSFEVSEVSAVDVGAYIGYVSPDEGDEYYYYGAGVSYGYSLSDNASVSLFVNLYGAEEDIKTDSDLEFTYGFSFSAGF